MRRTLVLAAAALMLSGPVVTQALAASAPPPPSTWAGANAADGSIVHKAGWYCRRWRHRCARRWDWGTPRFNRCMWRHGC